MPPVRRQPEEGDRQGPDDRGSGVLVRSLMQASLIEDFTLLIHPPVLGSGRRLLDDGSPLATLKLTDSVTSPAGVVIATYRPACPAPTAVGDRCDRPPVQVPG